MENGPIKQRFVVEFVESEGRYIKVMAENIGLCPHWHKGSGGKAWLFVDEIIIQ